MKFVRAMKARYPDSLFIVTGDHAAGVLPLDFDIVPRREPNLRERFLTSFAMNHPDLTPEMFQDCQIGKSYEHPANTD